MSGQKLSGITFGLCAKIAIGFICKDIIYSLCRLFSFHISFMNTSTGIYFGCIYYDYFIFQCSLSFF